MRRCLYIVKLAALFAIAVSIAFLLKPSNCGVHRQQSSSNTSVLTRVEHVAVKNQSVHLIFLGGVPQSGFTALQSAFSLLPNVWCVNKSHIVAQILAFRSRMVHSPVEYRHLLEAGVTSGVIDHGVKAFLQEISAKSGRAGHYLLINDAALIVSLREMSSRFPNTKALVLNRDGRAVAHSAIFNKKNLAGFESRSFSLNLKRWNQLSEPFNSHCNLAGKESCLTLYYEQLVQYPEQTLKYVSNFLFPGNLPALHDEWIKNASALIHRNSLSHWTNSVPFELRNNVTSVAPMLERLGYDVHRFPPNQGENGTVNPLWLRF